MVTVHITQGLHPDPAVASLYQMELYSGSQKITKEPFAQRHLLPGEKNGGGATLAMEIFLSTYLLKFKELLKLLT